MGECHCTEVFHISKMSRACLHTTPFPILRVCSDTWISEVGPGLANIYLANMASVILASRGPSHLIGLLTERCGWMVLTPEGIRKIKKNPGVLSWLVSHQCMAAFTNLIFIQQTLIKHQLCASLCIFTSWNIAVNKTDTVLVIMEPGGHSVSWQKGVSSGR